MRSRARALAVVAGVALLTAACTHATPDGAASSGSTASASPSPSDGGSLVGARFTVLGDWTGADQSAVQAVIAKFDAETGARGVYVAASGGDSAAALQTDSTAGIPPDVALIDSPTAITAYARNGVLKPLSTATSTAVTTNFGGEWNNFVTVDGVPYAVPVNAVDESVLWYDPATLTHAGIAGAPRTWDGLIRASQKLVKHVAVPVALAGSDAWTLTNWFENVYLRTAGLAKYDRLARHELAWTDPSVAHALNQLGRLWGNPKFVGSATAALDRSYADSADAVFGAHANSAFAYGDATLPSVATADGDATTPVPTAFPALSGSGDVVEVSAHFAAALTTNPAAASFLGYLATPDAARVLVTATGSDLISPDRNVPASTYADDTSAQFAEQIAEAGDSVRTDLSQDAPASFGTAPRGMRAALRAFLANPNRKHAIARTQQRLETAADTATGWGG